MKIFYQYCFYLLSLVYLAGCGDQTLTYEKLMLNPKLLQQEYDHCAKSNLAHCEVVKRAAYDFEVLYEEQTSDPQAFGLKVMQQQAKLKALSEKDPQSNDYREALFTLDSYYAVIGLHSPQ